jgi:hypothetical protein
MRYRNDITAEFVRELLDYDPDTGILTWKSRPSITNIGKCWNAKWAGKPAGSIRPGRYPYVVINLLSKHYYAHRLAWIIYYGCITDSHIDHIDLDTTNNKINNLRLASNANNLCNSIKPVNNTSGVKGVYRQKTGWVACVQHNRKRHRRWFRTMGNAIAFARQMREKWHRSFANHG